MTWKRFADQEIAKHFWPYLQPCSSVRIDVGDEELQPGNKPLQVGSHSMLLPLIAHLYLCGTLTDILGYTLRRPIKSLFTPCSCGNTCWCSIMPFI